MNRDCNGDYFTVEGTLYYRCFLDGHLMRLGTKPDRCPACERKIEATDHGTAVEVRQVNQFRLPDEEWENLTYESEVKP